VNILLITYQGDVAGSTNSIAYLAEGLAKKGHTVVVGLRQQSLLFSMLEGSNVIRVPMQFRSRLDMKNIRQIRDVVRKYDIQLINAQSSLDRYTTIFARWLYNLPVRLVHTRRQPPKSIGGLQNLFYTLGTDRFVVISNELKKIFIEKGFKSKHLHVIHNGIPQGRYDEWSMSKVGDLRKKYKIKPGDIVIGSVARLKQHRQILEAVKKIDNPAIKVVFAGIKAEDLDTDGMKNQISFAGTVGKEEVLSYYRLFDLNILASVSDGFGLVLLEAMAMECPVIATDFGGIKDVVRHGENGLLFADGDIDRLANNITQIINDKELRNRLVENGLKTAFEEFTMENTIQKYETFFSDLINDK